MKKIYDREVRVQIGKYGQDWENTTMCSHFHLLEETKAKDTEDWYSRFADLDERILNDNIYNATVEDSRRGRKIAFSTVCRDFRYCIFKSKGTEYMREPIGIKITYKEVKNPTLEFLSKNLSVEEMFEYLRERGIPFCPLYK